MGTTPLRASRSSVAWARPIRLSTTARTEYDNERAHRVIAPSRGVEMPAVAGEIETRETRVKPRFGRLLCLAAITGGLLWGGWRWWENRRYRRAMAEIQAQIHSGRHNVAARNLIALLAWKPDSDQAAYLLGNCERAQGTDQRGLRSLGPRSAGFSVRESGDRGKDGAGSRPRAACRR